MANTILITGATAGIGAAAAQAFAAAGWHLILTGRRADRLAQLANELQKVHGVQVHTLTFDVRDAQAVTAQLEPLAAPTVLLNNAGLARGLSAIDQGLLTDWDEMIDTNLKGLLYVSRAIAPKMRAEGSGHIINVGSTAGKEAYPNGNVYVATKHAVDALTRAMRMDLVQAGIKVSAIHPGFVETEFSLVRFHGDAERAKKVYEGFRPLSPADVAQTILWMATAPAHMNIADVVLMPAAQASATIVRREG